MFNLGTFFKEVLPTAVILLPLTGAFVKWLGGLGIKGVWQLLSSMLTGLVLGGFTAYFITAPSAPAEWFAVALYGLSVGLATSGFYELQKASAEKAVEEHIEKVEEQAVMGGLADDQKVG